MNPLRGQNNVQGSAHMGCEPVTLPGGQSIADAAVRERFERAWGAPLSPAHGLNLMQMIDAAAGGRLAALWVMGYDVYLTLPNEAATASWTRRSTSSRRCACRGSGESLCKSCAVAHFGGPAGGRSNQAV